MAFTSNRPTVERLTRQLAVSNATAISLGEITGIDVATLDADLLAETLESSIDFVEEVANTSFDGRATTELRDGNGTNGLQLMRWPIGRVRRVKVSLPVLALDRTYLPTEIKVYRFQGHITIFTYKLAAEQASLHLDAQLYGNLFPRLPQCVTIDYTYGFPRYDATLDVTTWDGTEVELGDTRDPLDRRHLRQLQTAAVLDAAASILSQAMNLGLGLVQSVSFDGFSKSMNTAGYGPTVDALIKRRDELLARRRRNFLLSTT